MSGGLFALESGDGPGTPIVLLHGFGGSHDIWSDVQPGLTEDFRTLAYDLPGHAQSFCWEGRRVPAKMADGVWQDLKRRGEDRVHLVGHSLGGAVAALMAFSTPERVASLTLLAPGGFGSEINSRLLRRYAVVTDEDAARAILENMFGWSHPVPERSVQRTLEDRKTPAQRENLAEIAAHITRDDRQGTFRREQLAQLAMPVKVVWGTQDRVLPTRQAHRLPGHFATHIYEDTGHMLPEEIPGEVCRLVRENVRSF